MNNVQKMNEQLNALSKRLKGYNQLLEFAQNMQGYYIKDSGENNDYCLSTYYENVAFGFSGFIDNETLKFESEQSASDFIAKLKSCPDCNITEDMSVIFIENNQSEITYCKNYIPNLIKEIRFLQQMLDIPNGENNETN